MPAAQIGAGDRGQSILWRPLRNVAEQLERAHQHAGRRLRDQIFLRREVPVEAAMREADFFHEVGDPDALEAALPEQLGRRLNDPFTVARGLFSAHFHPGLLEVFYRLTVYM